MKEIILLLAIIALPIYLIYRLGKWQMKRDAKIEAIYNKMYKNIEDSINILSVNEVNYEAINDQIITLTYLKHKNREKTEVLYLKFLRKFAVKRSDEDEFLGRKIDGWGRRTFGDRSENKRDFKNRSDVDEVDTHFMSHIQG